MADLYDFGVLLALPASSNLDPDLPLPLGALDSSILYDLVASDLEALSLFIALAILVVFDEVEIDNVIIDGPEVGAYVQYRHFFAVHLLPSKR